MADAPKYLFIDGHSVIHAWEDLRKLHLRGALRYMAREELLKRMRTLQDMSGERVVVVFDGQGAKTTDQAARAKAYQDAEKLIMENALSVPVFYNAGVTLYGPQVKGIDRGNTTCHQNNYVNPPIYISA